MNVLAAINHKAILILFLPHQLNINNLPIMKTNYIILAVMALVISACTNRKPSEELLNKKAAIPASFNFSKAGLKVITSSINKKNKTMCTLYGNELALKNAISGAADHTA